MSNYYYRKDAGWVYTFQNVQHIYNADGSVTTRVGANDVVTTLGQNGIAPNGDTLYRVQIKYRVRQEFAGRNEIDIRYVCKGATQKGAFIDGNATIDGAKFMGKRPRPVSTDTIIAGVVGRVRTLADDFTNMAPSVYQIDTLWFTSHGDSVFIWEYMPGRVGLQNSRLLFCRNFLQNTRWEYDLTELDGTHPTEFKVSDPDLTVSTASGTFGHTVKIDVVTPEIYDNIPTSETKYFAYGTGFVKEFDEWYVTTDNLSWTKQDFTHSLISLVKQ
jgi:hypothetical protein